MPTLSSASLRKHQCGRNANNNTGQQRFCSMRENVCFWCIFGRWIPTYFQNFSISHTFRSRVKGWNLLRQDTKVCYYLGRHEEFKDIFSQEDGALFCNDVCSVMEVLCHEYKADQWHLFIDSSKVSLKVVLLHNGKRSPLRSFHSCSQHEGESWKHLGKYKYDEFKWKLSGDMKVVELLLRMQFGYTKYYCFLWECDSRDKKNKYVIILWPKRTSMTPGEKNVVNPPLILPEKIYLPPLNIKLGLMKTLWRVWIKPAVDSNMWGIIPKCERRKNQGGYIYRTPDQGTDARQIVFAEYPNETERNAWLSLQRIWKDFLGNHKAANYQYTVQDLLTSYKAMECNMRRKSTFWSHTWIFFPRKSRRIQWRTRWKISPTHYDYAKAVPKQVGHKYVGRLLLQTEERCTWCQIPTKFISLYILEKSFCLFHEHVKYYFTHLNSSAT